MIQLTYYIEPVGKARVNVVRHEGRSMAFTPEKTADAQAFIRAESISWANRHGVGGFPVLPEKMPLKVMATFILRRPEKPKNRYYPVTRPDTDNYCKLLLDSINGVLIGDDSQIVSLHAEKEYVRDGGLPRIELSIWEALPGDQPLKNTEKRRKGNAQ